VPGAQLRDRTEHQPAGALVHRSLAHYAPLRLLHDAVRAAAQRLR
jgi:hypothetical protein